MGATVGIPTIGAILALFLAAEPPPLVATQSDVALYVASTGDDSNSCTTLGSACLTIRGALAKAPRVLHHRPRIIVAKGAYAGAVVSGFVADVSWQQSTGGLVIEGSLSNAVLESGNATGQATTASSGSHATHGTLTDSSQNWAPNGLKDKFLVLTGGTGAGTIRPIVSNTPTTISVAGATFAADNSTTYAIQDSDSVISECVPQPATAIVNSIPNSAAFYVANNVLAFGSNATSLVIKNFKITAPCANGITIRGQTAATLSQIQFTAATATSNRVLAADGASVAVTGASSTTESTSLTHFSFSGPGNFSVVDSTATGGARGVVFSGACASCVANGLQTLGTQLAPVDVRAGAIAGLDGVRANCASATGNVGVRFGWPSSGTVGSVERGGAHGLVDRVNITGCDVAVAARGHSGVDVTSLTGTATSSVFDVRFGALLVFSSNSISVSGALSDVAIDGSAVSTFADIDVCASGPKYFSRVCKR